MGAFWKFFFKPHYNGFDEIILSIRVSEDARAKALHLKVFLYINSFLTSTNPALDGALKNKK